MGIYGPEGQVLYCKEHTEGKEAGRPSFGSSFHQLAVTKIQAGLSMQSQHTYNV